MNPLSPKDDPKRPPGSQLRSFARSGRAESINGPSRPALHMPVKGVGQRDRSSPRAPTAGVRQPSPQDRGLTGGSRRGMPTCSAWRNTGYGVGRGRREQLELIGGAPTRGPKVRRLQGRPGAPIQRLRRPTRQRVPAEPGHRARSICACGRGLRRAATAGVHVEIIGQTRSHGRIGCPAPGSGLLVSLFPAMTSPALLTLSRVFLPFRPSSTFLHVRTHQHGETPARNSVMSSHMSSRSASAAEARGGASA